ncbi:MAG TPA: tetratricopeptide repeat protein [Candidatus Nitrosotenuis sp.]|nr:tetratricopeptide repeat protein [Candidatus Nitrosotenuis sp.]
MKMNRALTILVAMMLAAAVISGCSRDPNVRKQKYLESGDRYFEKEKYREAAIQYLNAVQVDASFAEAHYKLAQCYLRMGVWSGAYQELTRTVELQPDNHKAQVDLGNLLLAAKEFKQALDIAERVLQKDPKNVDALILRANSEAALENLQDSLKSMQEAIQLAPDRPRSYVNLALLQLSAKQAASAEASFKKAIDLDPKSITAHLALANFYMSQNKAADAERYMRMAMEADPKSHLPYASLARLFIWQQQRDKAEQILAEAKSKLGDNPEGYRLLADYYFTTGQLDKAVEEFGALFQQHPKDAKIKKNYVQVLILKGRIDEAAKLNDEVLKESARDADALIHRGQIFMRQNKPNDAVQVLESVIKSESDNAVAQYHLGVAFAALGNLTRAEACWREAARLRPNMTAAHQALAGLAARRNDIEQMLSNAQQVIATDPVNPDGYLLRAAARLSKREPDFVNAEADLKRAIDLAPRSGVPLARLGALRAGQKRFPEAIVLYEQALERDPANPEALQGVAAVYVTQKQHAKALARIQQQINKVPNNAPFHYLLGSICMAMNDLEKSEQALVKAIELNKDFLDAFILLAQVQVMRGSVERAVATYERAIAENPRDFRAYLMLGSLEETRRKNVRRAQELYEKALQIQPDYPLAANNLAYLLLENGGNVDVALSYAQTARRGMPNVANVADTLAWAFYHKGFYTQAIPLLEEALKSDANNPTYHFHMGMSFFKMGEKARARVHLQRAVDLKLASPDLEKAQGALRELGG